MGEAPPTTAAPAEIRDKKYSYSFCGIAWYENQAQYTGDSCCKECQDDNHFSYTLDKISWKAGDCYCIDTSRDNCGSDEFETDSGWTTKDCSQSRRRRRRDTEVEVRRRGEDEVEVMRRRDTEVEVRAKRSVETLTQREITCTALYQSGQTLYWEYQYQVPHSCWSESVEVMTKCNTFYISSQELTAPKQTWTPLTRTGTMWSFSITTMTSGTPNTTSESGRI